MNIEKPRMLEESSTMPSRCRMGKSWTKKRVRPEAGLGREERQAGGGEGRLGYAPWW